LAAQLPSQGLNQRRLVREHERLMAVSEAMIYLAMGNLLRRRTPNQFPKEL
jgi:hypothetical protein